MNSDQLYEQIRQKKSFLCVGLDTDLSKIPDFVLKSDYPQFEFNRRIVEATHDLVVAYKPNLAFYESAGSEGIRNLKLTIDYIRENHPEILLIADAKRGDISNTSEHYAGSFFKYLNVDAVTLNPYLGKDSIEPYLHYPDKWVILLGLTSNPGSKDFQLQKTAHKEEYFFEYVVRISSRWGSTDNMMFVIGATQTDFLKKIRLLLPDHFLLIPGIGVQGGSLEEVVKNGLNLKCGLLVNVSRSVLYASQKMDFDVTARQRAIQLQMEMEKYLRDYNLI